MDANSVQAIIAPAFVLIGLSHLLRPQLWVQFMAAIKQTGLASAIIPMYTLPVGLVLIVGHNVWDFQPALFLTISGWLMTIKSTIYILVPGLADRALERPIVASPRSYQVVGAFIAFFGGILTWQSWA